MIRETIARIRKRMGDVVFHGRNKAMISIGTDRKDTINSGYGEGGENDVDSAAIDMVVGFPADATQPDYDLDKSRIYIAEKTDPDDYFKIDKGGSVQGEPAIVQTSDNIYLKARSKIKILNGNTAIIIDEDGNLTIEASDGISIACGESVIKMSPNGNVSIGTGSAAEDFPALSRKTNDELESIRNLIRTLVLPLNPSGTAAGPPTIVIPPSNSVAATKVKID